MVDALTGKIAFVFPGQGSQFVGMGIDLVDASPAARRTFLQANHAVGFPLSELAFRGPGPDLEDTINAQPAILTMSIAVLEAIKERLAERGGSLEASMVAGHSLGEFSALVAANVLSFEDAVALVRERGRLMKEAGIASPGGMAAILGLDDDALAAVCAEASGPDGVVVLANQNCPGQIVISGAVAPLERAMELAKASGAKRATRLGVSIASHSPLMKDAAAAFTKVVDGIGLREPKVPVIGNVTATALTTASAIREELALQIESPVRWTDSVTTMVEAGVTTFVEMGPGAVLGSLIKRISRDVKTIGLGDLGLDLPVDKPAAS